MGNIMNSKRGAAVLFGALFLWATSGTAIEREWGYDPPKVLPPNWDTLAVNACPPPGPSTAQSPIDFSQSKNTPKDMRVRRKNLRDIVYDYNPQPISMINRGFDVQVSYDSNPTSNIQLTKNGPLYRVLQYHFHAPSEHTVENGALFDMEIHIVHQNVENESQLAVVGVWVKQGEENTTLKPIFDNMNNVMDEGDTFNSDVSVNIGDALPDDRRYFAYDGSLTTPNCAEIVEWRVIREPIEMSKEQIDAFIKVLDNSCCPINGNNRPTQAINGRRIHLDKNMK